MTNYDTLVAAITEDVKDIQTRYSFSVIGQAFMFWYATRALDLSEEEAEEAVGYEGGNDKAIDLFYVDEEHNRVIVAQGKFAKSGRHKADEGEFLKLIHSTDWLSNPETFRRAGRADLADAAEDYVSATGRGFSTDLHYVFMGRPPPRWLTPHKYLTQSTARMRPVELHGLFLCQSCNRSTTSIQLRRRGFGRQQSQLTLAKDSRRPARLDVR